jgi:hypothetical protein
VKFVWKKSKVFAGLSSQLGHSANPAWLVEAENDVGISLQVFLQANSVFAELDR